MKFGGRSCFVIKKRKAIPWRLVYAKFYQFYESTMFVEQQYSKPKKFYSDRLEFYLSARESNFKQ